MNTMLFRILRRSVAFSFAAFALWNVALWAAPSDDGQTAGSRSWVLNAGRLFAAVTPSDSTDLAIAPTRWIITGGAAGCTLAVRGADNGTTAVTLTLNPGVMYSIQVNRILSSGTSCTSIVAVY